MLKPEGKRFAAVTWDDPTGSGHGALAEHELPHAPIRVTTYGWVMRDDDVGVTIVPEVCGDQTFRDTTFVMRKLIVEVVEIPIHKPKRKAAPVVAP